MEKRTQYRLGMAAYHAGRYDKAIEMLAPLGTEGSGAQDLLNRYYLGQAHFRLAVQRFEQKRFEEATRHFQLAAGLNASGGGFATYLASCYVKSGQYDLAAREFDLMLQQNPNDPQLRIRLALSQYRGGSPFEAMATLREGICQTPEAAELHYQLGVMLAADNDFIEAERSFEMALHHAPKHVAAHERLAQICAVSNRPERALEYMKRAQALDPTNARVAFQLCLMASDESTADRITWHVPTVQPEAEPNALDRLGEAIAEDPDFVETFLRLPESDVDAEVFATLAATLERALGNRPEYADLHYHCGAVYRRLDRTDQAIAHAQQAVDLNPRYVNALILLAKLYRDTDRWAEGAERLESAIAAGGDYADVHYLLGELYQAGGQMEQARKAYRRALDVNGNFQAARRALAAMPEA